MGRSTYTLQQAQQDLAAGQRAYEARNAQINDWSAREKERIEREFAAKKAALLAAREKREAADAAAASSTPSGSIPSHQPGLGLGMTQALPAIPVPAQMMHVVPGPVPMSTGPAQAVPVPVPVPIYHAPSQGQVPVQIPIQHVQPPQHLHGPAQAQVRNRKPPAETMRDIQLLAICKRRVDNGARTQRINAATKAGSGTPNTLEPPLPDIEWYVAEETRRAVGRGDITWKEIKRIRRDEEGGCCVLM